VLKRLQEAKGSEIVKGSIPKIKDVAKTFKEYKFTPPDAKVTVEEEADMVVSQAILLYSGLDVFLPERQKAIMDMCALKTNPTLKSIPDAVKLHLLKLYPLVCMLYPNRHDEQHIATVSNQKFRTRQALEKSVNNVCQSLGVPTDKCHQKWLAITKEIEREEGKFQTYGGKNHQLQIARDEVLDAKEIIARSNLVEKILKDSDIEGDYVDEDAAGGEDEDDYEVVVDLVADDLPADLIEILEGDLPRDGASVDSKEYLKLKAEVETLAKYKQLYADEVKQRQSAISSSSSPSLVKELQRCEIRLKRCSVAWADRDSFLAVEPEDEDSIYLKNRYTRGIKAIGLDSDTDSDDEYKPDDASSSDEDEKTAAVATLVEKNADDTETESESESDEPAATAASPLKKRKVVVVAVKSPCPTHPGYSSTDAKPCSVCRLLKNLADCYEGCKHRKSKDDKDGVCSVCADRKEAADKKAADAATSAKNRALKEELLANARLQKEAEQAIKMDEMRLKREAEEKKRADAKAAVDAAKAAAEAVRLAKVTADKLARDALPPCPLGHNKLFMLSNGVCTKCVLIQSAAAVVAAAHATASSSAMSDL
jgi:hypothetical protein